MAENSAQRCTLLSQASLLPQEIPTNGLPLIPLHQTVTQLWQRARQNIIKLASYWGFCFLV
jgi:hypothetical protein